LRIGVAPSSSRVVEARLSQEDFRLYFYYRRPRGGFLSELSSWHVDLPFPIPPSIREKLEALARRKQ
jgi:hypothetical protein